MAVGWQQPVYLPNPVAGGVWSYKVDGRYYERLLMVHFTTVTDAVAGNRFAVLQLHDSNGRLFSEVPASGAIAASTTIDSYISVHGPAFANEVSGSAYGFMPDVLLPPDWMWGLTVFGIDAADQVSNVSLLVQRFPNDAAVVPVVG